MDEVRIDYDGCLSSLVKAVPLNVAFYYKSLSTNLINTSTLHNRLKMKKRIYRLPTWIHFHYLSPGKIRINDCNFWWKFCPPSLKWQKLCPQLVYFVITNIPLLITLQMFFNVVTQKKFCFPTQTFTFVEFTFVTQKFCIHESTSWKFLSTE